MQTSLTEKQKLQVLSYHFYQGSGKPWDPYEPQPKKGDYYTTPRADLELYQIADEDDEYFYTVYCSDTTDSPTKSKWKKDEFLLHFGINRKHVPEWVFNIT